MDHRPQPGLLNEQLVGFGRQAQGPRHRVTTPLEGGERDRLAADTGAVVVADLVEADQELHWSMWSSITCWKWATTM